MDAIQALKLCSLPKEGAQALLTCSSMRKDMRLTPSAVAATGSLGRNLRRSTLRPSLVGGKRDKGLWPASGHQDTTQHAAAKPGSSKQGWQGQEGAARARVP